MGIPEALGPRQCDDGVVSTGADLYNAVKEMVVRVRSVLALLVLPSRRRYEHFRTH
jgi:hypothetical protein